MCNAGCFRLLATVTAAWFSTALGQPAAPEDVKPDASPPAEVKPSEPNQPAAVKPPEPAQPAEPKKEAPKSSVTDRLKLLGKAFLRYSYELEQGRGNYNEFDIDRVYFGAEFKPVEKLVISLTFEGGDLRQNGNDYFDVTTKGFYLEVQDFLFDSTFFRLGQINLPWVPYEEGIWGYRFQGSIFPDRMGYLTSTDLGVALGGKLPAGYGDLQLNVVNGEGWKKNESGKRKDFHGRLTLRPLASVSPLKGLFLTGFAALGHYDDMPSANNAKRRFIGQIGYREEGKLMLAADYLATVDPAEKLKGRYPSLAANSGEALGNGYSVYGVLNLSLLGGGDYAKKWEVLARWDRLDPDSTIDGNDVDLFLAGVSFRWNRHVQTLLDWERVAFRSGAQKPNETRGMLQTELKF